MRFVLILLHEINLDMPSKFIPKHNYPFPFYSPKGVKARFEAKFKRDETTGCWLWVAAKDKYGYGSVWNSRLKRVDCAHRVGYELYKGEIPKGMFLCHKCDTPACVNPDHFFLGTQKDNVQDSIDKGRHSSLMRHVREAARASMIKINSQR
jgi:hypothetical protein